MNANSWLSASVWVGALLMASTAAAASSPPKVDAQGRLTGAAGMTLYTYAPDGTSNVSHCTGPCAAVWPPYVADPGAVATAKFGLIRRPDHSEQWSYQGHPLYRYAADNKPGMTKGDGVNGVWHVAKAHD